MYIFLNIGFVALSLYYWNTHLDQVVIRKIKEAYPEDVIFTLGEPSIDSDLSEQHKMFERFPEVHALVPSELELCSKEWIDLQNIKRDVSLSVDFDVIKWKKKKFKTGLQEEKSAKKVLQFNLDKNIKNRIEVFNKDFKDYDKYEYFYQAFEFIVPRSNLQYTLSYK